MRRKAFLLLLILAAIALSGCRFAVIETGSVRVAPTAEAAER